MSPTSTHCVFSDEATFHVCRTLNRYIVVYGKVKIPIMLLNMSVIYQGQCMIHFDGKQSDGTFLFWRNYSDWWHFSDYCGGRCFASCPCGNIFELDGASPHFCHRVYAYLGQRVTW